MALTLGRMTLLVEDQDAAADFYAAAFGFVRLYDQVLPNGFRAVHIGLSDDDGAGLWLMPSTEAVGRQTAGHPLLVLYTDDLDGDLARLAALGVAPSQGPIREQGSAYVHVPDLYGNDLVLVELAPAAAQPGSPGARHRAPTRGR
jgi:catechol 2,3-dioxygenase-like lactoylglutathione lyase family enzyme